MRCSERRDEQRGALTLSGVQWGAVRCSREQNVQWGAVRCSREQNVQWGAVRCSGERRRAAIYYHTYKACI